VVLLIAILWGYFLTLSNDQSTRDSRLRFYLYYGSVIVACVVALISTVYTTWVYNNILEKQETVYHREQLYISLVSILFSISFLERILEGLFHLYYGEWYQNFKDLNNENGYIYYIQLQYLAQIIPLLILFLEHYHPICPRN
jgi:hypothetical protein